MGCGDGARYNSICLIVHLVHQGPTFQMKLHSVWIQIRYNHGLKFSLKFTSDLLFLDFWCWCCQESLVFICFLNDNHLNCFSFVCVYICVFINIILNFSGSNSFLVCKARDLGDKYETSSAYKPPAQDGSDSGNFWKYQTLKHKKGRSGLVCLCLPTSRRIRKNTPQNLVAGHFYHLCVEN